MAEKAGQESNVDVPNQTTKGNLPLTCSILDYDLWSSFTR